MFPHKTVFILGSGASQELGLPIGADLKRHITDALAVETAGRSVAQFRVEPIADALGRQASRDGGNDWPIIINRYGKAAAQIRGALPLALSIDNYVDGHRGNIDVASLSKLAITYSILKAEKECHLYPSSGIDMGGLAPHVLSNPNLMGSWYIPLMQLITSGQSINDLRVLFDNIGFIVFNYDRCIEQFLVNAISNYYNVGIGEAVDAVCKLQIVHPYGQVGFLPWQQQKMIARFGQVDVDLIEVAKSIQTFTESVNSGIVESVRNMVGSADTLVFMGYGFLPQNNQLLQIDRAEKLRRVFATTYGIGGDDVEVVLKLLSIMVGKGANRHRGELDHHVFQPFLEDGKCSSLMKNHWLRLSQD